MKKMMCAVAMMASGLVFAAEVKKEAPKAAPAAAPAAAAKAAPAAPAGKFELKGDAAKGEVTFKTMCAACHGETGKGDGAAAAALNPKPADFTDAKRAAAATDEYVYKMVKDGGAANGKSPMMTPWGPVLNDDQKVRDVAAYVRTLSAKKPDAAKPAGKDAKPAPVKDAKVPPKK